MSSIRKTMTPPSVRSQNPDRSIDATFQFITPMFGGGVESGKSGAKHQKNPDPITPVRGSAVRGQLRMWWRRACTQGVPADRVREREKLLWGWASTQDEPNRALAGIVVDASGLQGPQPVEIYDKHRTRNIVDGMGHSIGYGAFPLQPGSGSRAAPGTLSRYSGTFSLTLSVDVSRASASIRLQRAWSDEADPLAAAWKEVQQALALFGAIGGLGSRTRRGFGAMERVDEQSASPAEVVASTEWPVATGSPCQDGMTALNAALRAMQTFRQGPGVGRNPGQQNRPGRSRWPEPDLVRRRSRTHAPQHQPEHPVDGVAPRAAFGMPIILHFKDDRKGDPTDHTIQPPGQTRLASPILLRPTPVGGGRYAPMAVRLPLMPGDRNVLNVVEIAGASRKHHASGQLTDNQARDLRPLNGQKDVLKAFLDQFPSLTKGS